LEIRSQVVEAMTSFKDSKQRVKKRVKEELRTASNEYADYKASVSRYQKVYDRSCEAVKQMQQSQISLEASTTSDSTLSNSSPKQSIDIVSGVTTAHLRDNNPPPAHTAAVRVNDALKQSGQQISTFINRLGGSQTPTAKSPPDTNSSASMNINGATHVAKLVKAKKEAEVADSDYRKGIYHLETLRLQKERVHRSAGQSVLEFVAELAFVMKGKALSVELKKLG
jgi:hypothetical protein